TLVSGTVRLTIPQGPDQPHTLRVTTPAGTVAFQPGRYTLRVAADKTRVSVWEGRADAMVRGASVAVAVGSKLVADKTSFDVVDVLENVLANGDFSRSFEGWEPWEDREKDRPDVAGHLEIVQVPDASGAPREALHISRTSERDA